MKRNYILVDDFGKDDDPSLFEEHILPYLRELFKDLTQRCYDQKAVDTKQLDKMTFIEYCQLPVIIGERLFAILDTDASGLMSEAEFSLGLSSIFFDSL